MDLDKKIEIIAMTGLSILVASSKITQLEAEIISDGIEKDIKTLIQSIKREIVLDETRFNEEIFDILNNSIDTADPKESISSITFRVIKEVNRQLKQKLKG